MEIPDEILLLQAEEEQTHEQEEHFRDDEDWADTAFFTNVVHGFDRYIHDVEVINVQAH